MGTGRAGDTSIRRFAASRAFWNRRRGSFHRLARDVRLIENRAVSTLVALMAAANLFVPASADAVQAMFRVERAWHEERRNWTHGSEPSSMQPPAIATVGTTTVAGKAAQKFTLPRGFIDTIATWYCRPGTCYKGYPISGGVYSVLNLQGRFRPFNPYGATTTTALRFPTTMSSTLPAKGLGEPVTPTTTFPLNTAIPRGLFDFSRGGSIRVTPGPHRFGGTMRYFFGPNSFWYQYITLYTADPITRGYFPQTQWQRTEYDEAELREIVSGGYGHLYVFTSQGRYQMTYGGDPRTDRVQHIYSEMPWTTGTVRVYEPLWPYVTTLTYRGSDARTPAGLNGKMSLVSARLRHPYRMKEDPPANRIKKRHSTARVSTLEVTFLPEPEAIWMLGAGIVTLAALIRLRPR